MTPAEPELVARLLEPGRWGGRAVVLALPNLCRKDALL